MTDEDAIRAAVLDYVEGWFDGNVERIDSALHPELVKRCLGIEGDDPEAVETLTARDMIDATAAGEGRGEDAGDREISVRSPTCAGRSRARRANATATSTCVIWFARPRAGES